MYDDIRSEFTELEERFQHLRSVFDIDSLREQKNALQQETTAPDFWDDQQKAQQTLQKIAQFDEQLDKWANVRSAR